MTAALVSARYAPIERLPEGLRQEVLAHPHGQLLRRVDATLVMRRALLAGGVPELRDLAWPEPELARMMLDELRAGGLAPHCRDDDALTEEVLREWLGVASRVELFRLRAIAGLCERACAPPPRGRGDARNWQEVLSPDDWERVERDAAIITASFARERAATDLRRSWTDRIRAWVELADYVEKLFAHTFAPPGLGRGWLASVPRSDLTWLRAMLAALPPLADLVRTLGRMKESASPDAPPAFERVLGPIRRTREIEREIAKARVAEVRGIERTGEIARMLASESILLARPRLRGLFHAKLAERSLLGYHAEGVLTQRILTPDGASEGVETRVTRAERGPIVVVLDTSASMNSIGDLAAALVLQIVVLAHFERRPVFAMHFSGPGELARLELSLEPKGISAMLGLLSTRFGGGTVIEPALRCVQSVLRTDRHAFADVVMVSDGQLFIAPDVVADIRELKRRKDVRFHAIHVGHHTRFSALQAAWNAHGPQRAHDWTAIADVFHELEDWTPRD